jgi:hypothetical protein
MTPERKTELRNWAATAISADQIRFTELLDRVDELEAVVHKTITDCTVIGIDRAEFRRKNRRLRAMLRDLTWTDATEKAHACAWCGCWQVTGHEEGCRLAALLEEVTP